VPKGWAVAFWRKGDTPDGAPPGPSLVEVGDRHSDECEALTFDHVHGGRSQPSSGGEDRLWFPRSFFCAGLDGPPHAGARSSSTRAS